MADGVWNGWKIKMKRNEESRSMPQFSRATATILVVEI